MTDKKPNILKSGEKLKCLTYKTGSQLSDAGFQPEYYILEIEFLIRLMGKTGERYTYCI